jgi:hypothetical protein
VKSLTKLRIKTIKSANRFSKTNLTVFALIFAAIGGYVIYSSFAAGFSASLEGENSTLAGCATTGSDAGASGGSLVKFTSCSSQTQTLSSVSQYGITWTFDSPHTVGKYANGDYWVLGPVTITSITPNAASGQNGWEVNPGLAGNDVAFGGNDPTAATQAWDSGGPYYKASNMPALPYTATAGQSIVKGIAHAGRAPGADCEANVTPCLDSAAILTVVGSPPANNGTTVFRPPFVGTSKPQFSTTSLDTNISNLPRLASNTSIDAVLPTLSAALATVQRPDIGWSVEEWRSFHPVLNTSPPGGDPYAPGLSGVYNDAVFRALIAKTGDSETTRRQLLIALVQRGIDVYGERAMGMHWYAAGGHNLGPRPMLSFAAWMLNDTTLKNSLSSAGKDDFAETATVQPNKVSGGQPVWGQPHCTHPIGDCETSYWTALSTSDDTATPYDPYGYIDGAYTPSTSYQQCCTSSALVGDALMVHLIPGMDTIWNAVSGQDVYNYAVRWKNHGLWTKPDPCAPLTQGGGKDPAHPGQCILDPDLTAGSTFTSFSCQAGKQCGRFPTIDGESMHDCANLSAGGGGCNGDWGNTDLLRAMWGQYGP